MYKMAYYIFTVTVNDKNIAKNPYKSPFTFVLTCMFSCSYGQIIGRRNVAVFRDLSRSIGGTKFNYWSAQDDRSVNDRVFTEHARLMKGGAAGEIIGWRRAQCTHVITGIACHIQSHSSGYALPLLSGGRSNNSPTASELCCAVGYVVRSLILTRVDRNSHLISSHLYLFRYTYTIIHRPIANHNTYNYVIIFRSLFPVDTDC